MLTVGERIKQRRIEMGYTQDELARKMGYKGKSSVCKAETWGNDITMNKVSKFAKALECTSASLMGWDDEESFLSKAEKKYSTDLLCEVYDLYGYEGYVVVELMEKMNQRQLDHIFKYVQFLCANDNVHIPSRDEVMDKYSKMPFLNLKEDD